MRKAPARPEQTPSSLNMFQAGSDQLGIGELTVVIDFGLSEYIGTRIQIESESIIPSGTEWPDGFRPVDWETDGLWFRLVREKPKGAKGPRRAFWDCDNWCLRIGKSGLYLPHIHIAKKAMELRRLVFEQTPEGQAVRHKFWEQYYAARKDEAFQAFKGLIPGLIPPPKQRKQRKLQQGENHG